MPPVNQGNRTALLAWTVVSSVLFVTTAILAIVFYVNASSAEERVATLEQQYGEVLAPADLGGTALQPLRTARQGEERLLNVALGQSESLSRFVAGVANPTEAREQAAAAVARAAEAAGGATAGGQPAGDASPITPEPLVAAIDSLRGRYAALRAETDQLRDQLDQAQQAQQTLVEQTSQQLAAKDQQVAQSQQQARQARDEIAQLQQQRDQQFTQYDQGVREQLDVARGSVAQTGERVRELEGQLASRDQENQVLRGRLEQLRLPIDQILRVPDGRVVQAPGGGVVYINLGSGSQVVPGMTFEVFDRDGGIPNPTAEPNAPDQTVRGKAAIEITRVQPNGSEARIIRTNRGQSIQPGDVLVNLVYDPNTQYNFVVFGNFDLNRDGRADPADADVIRRLITQWGGNVGNDVDVSTDFLVLGREPQVPNFSEEELADPVNRFNLERANAELDAWNATRERAQSLSVPILNQNRFLYFVGYYDLAGR